MIFLIISRLISYINDNSDSLGLTVRYAVVSDYIKVFPRCRSPINTWQAVNDLNLTWPIFRGDFFPYQDAPRRFSSGYFTTRPWLKAETRRADNLLRTGEVMTSLGLRGGEGGNLTSMRYATAVVTHHDAGEFSLIMVFVIYTLLSHNCRHLQLILQWDYAWSIYSDRHIPYSHNIEFQIIIRDRHERHPQGYLPSIYIDRSS